MVCLICLRCAIFRDEVSKGIVDVLLCAWSNTAFPAQPSTSNLGNVRDGRGRCDKTHSVRMVLFPSPSPWWGFPRATARSTALLRLCLQSCSRLLLFFSPCVLCLRFFSDFPLRCSSGGAGVPATRQQGAHIWLQGHLQRPGENEAVSWRSL